MGHCSTHTHLLNSVPKPRRELLEQEPGPSQAFPWIYFPHPRTQLPTKIVLNRGVGVWLGAIPGVTPVKCETQRSSGGPHAPAAARECCS